MFVVGDRVVCGATDLEHGARCEFALLRGLDAELGTVSAADSGIPPASHGFGECGVPPETGSGAARFAELRATARSRYGAGLVEPAPPADPADPLGALAVAHSATVAAIHNGAPAVLGAVFFDGDFFTHAELVIRSSRGLSLHGVARAQPVPTALRLAAAAELVESLSIPADPRLHIHIDGETPTIEATDVQPVYRARRRRMHRILDDHSTELLPVQWGDPRFRACGRCTVCTAARAEARDLLLVAGMDPATRTALRAAGITTIDRLTTRITTPPEVPAHSLARLRTQAVVQLRQENSGRGELLPADPAALDILPPATPGDLGLHIHRVAPDRLRVVVAGRESPRLSCEIPVEPPAGEVSLRRRTALREGARRAFSDLLAALTEPLLAHPDLHIYHYTAAARTLLLHTAGRLGAGEETVDALLRTGVLVDLYPILRGAFVLGTRSYDLAPVAAALGRPGDPDGGTVLWLADRFRAESDTTAQRPPGTRTGALDRLLRDTPPVRPSSTEAALAEYAGRRETGAEQQTDASGSDPHRVAALTAALLGYHRREQQTSWWAHIDRLTHPLSEWAPDHGVMVADSCAVDTKWHIGPGDTVRRFLRLRGRLAGPGLAPGTRVHVVYEAEHRAPRAVRTAGPATVLGCSVDPDLTDTVRLEETLLPGAAAHDELPVALAPALPDPPTDAVQALESIGEQLLVALPGLPDTPIFDLLARRPPRLHSDIFDSAFPATGPATTSGAGSVVLPGAITTEHAEPAEAAARIPDTHEPGHWEPPALPPIARGPGPAITAALRALDRSYLAVQAPTGTGRTVVLAEALAALVIQDGWRIGIVAPTAAPVENLLDAIVRAGVLPELVAKSDAAAVAPEWLVLDPARYSRFLANAIRGCVVGGTPDDFTDPARVPRDVLDLLVVADVNSFPLAITAAVSVSARNLLLTGDPTERLRPGPGPHPEPVDSAALTWPADGQRTLPATHGYFLDRTHRMDPRICDPVSRVFFDDRLRVAPAPVHPGATLEPGIATVLVEHHGNTTSSEAEAREVLQQIREVLGRTWNDGTGNRPVQPHDIVVVSPHRAQVSLIRTLLSRARIDEVLVGTPELFRGREAAVVLVSPASSTPEDAPGPVGALLSAALIHDTLCRARRRAVIVRSPLLTEYLPETLGELSALADFLRL